MLWIALKLIIFDRLKTANAAYTVYHAMLWIALKLIIFDRLKTARKELEDNYNQLWIALKLIIFDRLKTAKHIIKPIIVGCELLSNLLSLIDWKQPGS